MATKIPTEIVIKILNNLQSSHSTRDLYSSLLVNRIWCRATIPILWELALSQKCKGNKKKALCIRTYISCMDTQARTLLTQNGFDLSSSPPQAIFDYPSFTHKLLINNLVYFISKYSPQIIGLYEDNYNNKKKNEITITKSRILFREICKLIINRCSFMDYFKLEGVFSRIICSYRDLIGSILKLPGAPKVFKKLESFTSTIRDHALICPLYESLKLICDNILNMDLFLHSHSQAQLFAELISAQKHLENLSIGTIYKLDYNSIFWAIISQKETLKSLRLKSICFYNFEGKSSSIGQFISLQELYIENCDGLHNSDCLFFASSFTHLSSFHYIHSNRFTRYPQEFIIKIFETVNTNLRNICLELYPTITFVTFSAILNYVTKITNLTLHNLSLEQAIAIFNNNFDELRRFSFDCFDCRSNADELLCQMAENVPKSLETIEIRMGIFSADSLRKFFEGWCCKGGGGNKKIIVNRTGHARLFRFTMSDEYFKVIEEYGVELNLI